MLFKVFEMWDSSGSLSLSRISVAAFTTVPSTELPLLSVYSEKPDQGLPGLIKLKSPESVLLEGQEWMQTQA